MTTYSKADWQAAGAAWEAVLTPSLLALWAPWRQLAALRGIIYPPTGTRWDQWDDPQPSQMAIIGQAIADTPDLLRQAIAGSWGSWSPVIGVIIRERRAYRESADLAERDDRWDRQDEPSPREATVALKRILERDRGLVIARRACMDDDEWADWLRFALASSKIPLSPCSDCLVTFAREQLELGKCDGAPGWDGDHRTRRLFRKRWLSGVDTTR